MRFKLLIIFMALSYSVVSSVVVFADDINYKIIKDTLEKRIVKKTCINNNISKLGHNLFTINKQHTENAGCTINYNFNFEFWKKEFSLSVKKNNDSIDSSVNLLFRNSGIDKIIFKFKEDKLFKSISGMTVFKINVDDSVEFNQKFFKINVFYVNMYARFCFIEDVFKSSIVFYLFNK